ncbi:MAG: LptA/OstA family protein [Verrucomicrobiota bacterium]|nr:LptA/OstA family protein [Verrucomicrobiota bacterium]
MIRPLSKLALCGCLVWVASCSKRERSDPEAGEWADIQALADDAAVVPMVGNGETNEVQQAIEPRFAPPGEFDAFIQRLEQMKSVERKVGETLLTGERMMLDHDRRHVRMDEHVVVADDQGTLKTKSLIGRFSVSNEVESIEAKGGVEIESGTRRASADQAVYSYQNGFVQLEGKATASDGGNRLSGERIELWIKGDRKMVCEPNALLEVTGASGFMLDGVPGGAVGDTEIRADRAVYDESKGRAELVGNVRVRDPRGAMNSESVRLFLKEGSEIDWIEASGGVIIQSSGRKALADRATYHADEGKFTLEGGPKVKQGQHIMTGDRITFWHGTRRMVCEPNARVLLYLDDETKAKFLKDLNK